MARKAEPSKPPLPAHLHVFTRRFSRHSPTKRTPETGKLVNNEIRWRLEQEQEDGSYLK